MGAHVSVSDAGLQEYFLWELPGMGCVYNPFVKWESDGRDWKRGTCESQASYIRTILKLIPGGNKHNCIKAALPFK